MGNQVKATGIVLPVVVESSANEVEGDQKTHTDRVVLGMQWRYDCAFKTSLTLGRKYPRQTYHHHHHLHCYHCHLHHLACQGFAQYF